jgi:hypothetical protein
VVSTAADTGPAPKTAIAEASRLAARPNTSRRFIATPQFRKRMNHASSAEAASPTFAILSIVHDCSPLSQRSVMSSTLANCPKINGDELEIIFQDRGRSRLKSTDTLMISV